MPFLARDIYSMLYTHQLYGKAGTPATIINDRDGVLIVELEGGLRIPLLPKDLTNESPIIEAQPLSAVEEKPAAAIRRPKRAKPAAGPGPPVISIQQSMF